MIQHVGLDLAGPDQVHADPLVVGVVPTDALFITAGEAGQHIGAPTSQAVGYVCHVIPTDRNGLTHPRSGVVDYDSPTHGDLRGIDEPAIQVLGTGGVGRVRHRTNLLPRIQVIAIDGQLQPEDTTVKQQVIQDNRTAQGHRVVTGLKVDPVRLCPELVPLAHQTSVVKREDQLMRAIQG